MSGPPRLQGRNGSDDSPADWDDARVDAAYRARFDVQPPSGLAHRIAAELEPHPVWRWFGQVPGFMRTAISGALLVAVLVTTASIGGMNTVGPLASTAGLPSGALPAGSAGGTSATPTGNGRPDALGWPFPDTVTTSRGDFTVMSVDQAVAVRAGNAGPVEIAVGGWQSDSKDVRFCTFVPSTLVGQLESQCVNNRWLAASPEPNTGWYTPPVLPAIHIALGIRRGPLGDPGIIHFQGGAVAVVMLGHFHDPAASQCGADTAQFCTDTFVVDEQPWVLSTSGHRAAPSDAGLEPMSVSEAIDVRDGGAATEIAVGGWFSAYAVPCPMLLDSHPPLENCVANFTWLMENPEELAALASDGSGSIGPPEGPAFNLIFDNATVPAYGAVPVRMTLVGHFNDARASECPAGVRRIACSNKFVIDEFLFVDSGAGGSAPSP
jgi:hypothetical protein